MELALGRDAELIADLELLSDRFAFDEMFASYRMTALYRSGRLSDALDVYRDTRGRLITELGTEPGRALAELHERILRRDPGLMLTVTQPPGGSCAPDSLPRGAVRFVGREAELRLLTTGPGDASVLVITGMPGAGKTALAVETARRLAGKFPDGQLFIAFGTHDPRNPPLDPAGALYRLLRMLRVPTERIPPGLDDRAALWRAHLARRRMIIVLDDVAGADQVRLLLPSPESGCQVLVTGRRRIGGLGNARTVVLGALSADDAVELLSLAAGLVPPAGPGEAAEAVRLCGRLPLAIELAAGGLRRGDPATVADLIEELSRPPSRLDGTASVGPQIALAFSLSYRSMADACQQFVRCLALHPGTEITVNAAAALGGVGVPEAQGLLDCLRDYHFLERGGQYIYFHDLVRRFAADCAVRDDPEHARRQAISRLLDYYRVTAGQAVRLLYPQARHVPPLDPCRAEAALAVDTPERAADWMDLEWRGILDAARYAAQHEQKRQCADLTRLLTPFLEAGGHWTEAAATHALALQASRDLDDLPGIAAASLSLSAIDNRSGRYEEALRHGEEAAAICRSLADLRGHAEALDQIGTIHRGCSQYREALAYHQEAGDLYQAAADVQGVADTLNHAGISCYHLGRYLEAASRMRAALTIYRQCGDSRGEAKAINNLGNMQRYKGYHRDALQSYQTALEIFEVIGGEQNQAILHHNIGCIHHYKGKYEEALASYRRGLAIYRRIDDSPGIITALNDIAVAYRDLGLPGEALIHHQRACDMSMEARHFLRACHSSTGDSRDAARARSP